MTQTIPLFPEAASTIARSIDLIYLFEVAVTIFFTFGIFAAVIGIAIKYRVTATHTKPTPIHGSLLLEVAWSVVPMGLALLMFAWGAVVWFDTARAPEGAMEFTITGKQWMWKGQHPTGQREINDLHVPVGVPIRLTMTSEDVIHSYFIPAFRMKQDVLPGRYSRAWFEATKVGTYDLFCAEYCGTRHSLMTGKIHVMEQRDYENWLSGGISNESPQDQGARLFEAMRCNTCHAAGSGQRGPHLEGLWGSEVKLAGGGTAIFDESYVRESILTPNVKIVAGYAPLMPTYAGQLSEEQILALAAYLKTLKAQVAPGTSKP